MKRLVIVTILKMCGEAILIAILAGIAVGFIGYKNQWDTSLEYGNAFFIAGLLVFVAGASSRLGASRDSGSYQGLFMESFRDMNPGERVNFIVDASSSFRLVILGFLSGLSLVLVSVFLTRNY